MQFLICSSRAANTAQRFCSKGKTHVAHFNENAGNKCSKMGSSENVLLFAPFEATPE